MKGEIRAPLHVRKSCAHGEVRERGRERRNREVGGTTIHEIADRGATPRNHWRESDTRSNPSTHGN